MQGHPGPAQLLAAKVTIPAGLLARHTLWAILAGEAAWTLGMGVRGKPHRPAAPRPWGSQGARPDQPRPDQPGRRTSLPRS